MTQKPIRLHQDIIFGLDGNEQGFLGKGWAEPEPGRRWTDGETAEIRLIMPGSLPFLLQIEAAPHILAPSVLGQRIEVAANDVPVGNFDLNDASRRALAVPPGLVPAGDLLHLRFGFPGAASLASLGVAPRAVSFKRLRLLTALSLAPRKLQGSAGLTAAEFPAVAGATLASGLARFEDIHGSAAAHVQQAAGLQVETLLGELSLSLPLLLDALDSGFAGLGDPGSFDIRVNPYDAQRYTVLDRELNAELPGRFAAGVTTLAGLIEQEATRLKQLRHALTSLLGDGQKILVASGPLLAESDALPLLIALNRLGTNTLLWLAPADAANPPGTVEQTLPCLLRGYCPPAPPAPDNLPAWLGLFANALRLLQGADRVAAFQLQAPAPIAAKFAPPQTTPAPARLVPHSPDQAIPSATASAATYTVVQTLAFGVDGNEETSIGFGWSGAEDGFRWTNGPESELWLEHPGPQDMVIAVAAWPYVDPPAITSQRLVLTVDKTELGSFTFADSGWRGLHVPAAALTSSKVLRLVCRLPDSARPADISGGEDDRQLGLAFMGLEISSFPAAPPARLTGRGGLHPDEVFARTGLQPDELVTRFETLGGSFTFAQVQSRAGAEPQGMLRYADMLLEALIDAIRNRLAGIGATGNLTHAVVEGDPPVYSVHDQGSSLTYVTIQSVDEVDPETLVLQHARRIRFLRDHLLEDMEAGERIFVYYRPAGEEELTEHTMLPLAVALRNIGPNFLLFVTEATQAAPPGTVESHLPGLMHGYLSPTASEAESQAQWLEICANALALRPRP